MRVANVADGPPKLCSASGRIGPALIIFVQPSRQKILGACMHQQHGSLVIGPRCTVPARDLVKDLVILEEYTGSSFEHQWLTERLRTIQFAMENIFSPTNPVSPVQTDE